MDFALTMRGTYHHGQTRQHREAFDDALWNAGVLSATQVRTFANIVRPLLRPNNPGVVITRSHAALEHRVVARINKSRRKEAYYEQEEEQEASYI